jgi:4'-phosphopantetheinyl transferase EntD
MIEKILPVTVAVEERRTDPPDAVLYPEEEALVIRAVPKRRAEFTTARLCARAALAALGEPPVAILPGPRGAPRWPRGVVGTITHCAGYRAAAVARAADLAAIGMDAEPHGPLPAGVLPAVSRPAEAAALAALARTTPGVHWDRMLFSAKESVYKAWFPLTGRWLDFEEAELTFGGVDLASDGIAPGPDGIAPGPDGAPATLDRTGTFTVRLLAEGPPPSAEFAGRWLVADGLVLTSVTVEPFPGCATTG